MCTAQTSLAYSIAYFLKYARGKWVPAPAPPGGGGGPQGPWLPPSWGSCPPAGGRRGQQGRSPCSLSRLFHSRPRGTFCSCRKYPKTRLGGRPRPLAVSRTASLVAVQVLRTWGRIFPTPFLLSCQKKRCRTAKEKRFLALRCVPLIDRRTKTGHTLPPAPLPLMLTKAVLSAAHGRAPGADIRWQQARPDGLTEFYNRRESGSGN